MNDPGLEEPINNAEDAVYETKEETDSDSDMDEQAEELNFLLPAKWWYASTAFPLTAGTFGPMANAFSICALVENWRVRIPAGGTEEHGIDIPDPKWLIAVNAVSLVCALIANMALLFNMARRLSFRIAQPITIIGFWLASVLLIALVAVDAHRSAAEEKENLALTQAYYYGIFAAGLYQVISYLMCVTAYGAYRGHYSKEFKLTMAQRTLMLQTISFLVYLLLGALVYSHVEGWKFLDAVYWADFTSLTIGIGGDYVPRSHLGRGLLFPFALGGILILGLVVGSIRSLVLDRSAKKLSARVMEKTRRRVVKRLAAVNASDNVKIKKKGIRGIDQQTASALTMDPHDDGVTEVKRRKAEFDAMRRVQEMAATERKWISLLTSTFAFAFLWTIGALVFWKAEKNQDWTYFASLYFAYTSLLTIGYGDLQPISNSGKPFFVFWSLLAVPTLTILISNMGDTVVKAIKDLTIWIGEVTVLPSEEGGTKDRLLYGVQKATNGKIDFYRADDDRDVEAEEWNTFQELNPGMIHMPRDDQNSERNEERNNEKETERDRQLATNFEQSEKQDEQDAKERGDTIAENEHHYRHVLISAIRQVWEDTNTPNPKKYGYAEWAYFLRLLGEDENDPRFHSRPPTKAKKQDKASDQKGKRRFKDSAAKQKAQFHSADQTDAVTSSGGQPHDDLDADDLIEEGTESGVEQEDENPDNDEQKQTKTKWSWIGTRSPLMGNKDESEWLLEKLFLRLDESLKDHWDQHIRENEEKRKKKETDEGEGTKKENIKSEKGGAVKGRAKVDEAKVGRQLKDDAHQEKNKNTGNDEGDDDSAESPNQKDENLEPPPIERSSSSRTLREEEQT